jgi:hypothetical protein
VNIRFTSSLTPEDENAIAPGLLTAITNILDLLPIAYSIRLDTADGQAYHHSGVAKVGDVHAIQAPRPQALKPLMPLLK